MLDATKVIACRNEMEVNLLSFVDGHFSFKGVAEHVQTCLIKQEFLKHKTK